MVLGAVAAYTLPGLIAIANNPIVRLGASRLAHKVADDAKEYVDGQILKVLKKLDDKLAKPIVYNPKKNKGKKKRKRRR